MPKRDTVDRIAQKELGDISEEGDEISQLEEDIDKAGMSKEALKKAKNVNF